MQTMKCLFVLAAVVLVVCVSADEQKGNDTRPVCFREKTEDEQKKSNETWEGCKGECTDDDKKDKKGYFLKNVVCYLKKYQLVKDNDEVDLELLKKRIDEHAVADYAKPLKDACDKCGAKLQWKEFFGCFATEKKNLPCKCHKECKKEEAEAKEAEDAAA